MELTLFITTLITQGKVSVRGKLEKFAPDDIAATKKLLQQYHADDILEMPFSPLPYNEEAALWAAEYFYKAVQLTVLRDAEEQKIKDMLQPFSGNISAASIYSADLILRYLPSLFELAKGLAPLDILVNQFYTTARQWPFSSVGIELKDEPDETQILSSRQLRQLYMDRIILARDKKRVRNQAIENHIYEEVGNRLNILWPGYEPIIK